MTSWLLSYERKIFFLINTRMQHAILDHVMNRITHLGGATFTISFSLFLSFFTTASWRIIGWQCLLALTISHIPVALIKRLYPRLRPYLVIPESNRAKQLLKDHSFPSGHTTAIFSIALPISLNLPLFGFFLIPLALIVGISRIYLGLHYPSDVIGGIVIATLASVGSVTWIG